MDSITQGRQRSLIYSQKTGRKGPDAVRRSLHSRNYKTGGIRTQHRTSFNTDCQNTPTQHQLSSVIVSQMPKDRITERNKTNKEQHSTENKRKMVKKDHAQKIAMKPNYKKLEHIEQSYLRVKSEGRNRKYNSGSSRPRNQYKLF